VHHHLLNADFFATAATVIPVLFLALLFPGGPLLRLLVWARKSHAREVLRGSSGGYKSRGRFALVGLLNWVVMIPGAGVVYGFWGEYTALQALRNMYASAGQQEIVFSAAIVLLAMVIVSPIAISSVEWRKSVHEIQLRDP